MQSNLGKPIVIRTAFLTMPQSSVREMLSLWSSSCCSCCSQKHWTQLWFFYLLYLTTLIGKIAQDCSSKHRLLKMVDFKKWQAPLLLCKFLLLQSNAILYIELNLLLMRKAEMNVAKKKKEEYKRTLERKHTNRNLLFCW